MAKFVSFLCQCRWGLWVANPNITSVIFYERLWSPNSHGRQSRQYERRGREWDPEWCEWGVHGHGQEPPDVQRVLQGLHIFQRPSQTQVDTQRREKILLQSLSQAIQTTRPSVSHSKITRTTKFYANKSNSPAKHCEVFRPGLFNQHVSEKLFIICANLYLK